jgi:hypothetical protein
MYNTSHAHTESCYSVYKEYGELQFFAIEQCGAELTPPIYIANEKNLTNLKVKITGLQAECNA